MNEDYITKEIKVKDFHRINHELKRSSYERLELNKLTKYYVNGFDVIPIPRTGKLLFVGNLHGLEEFLEKHGIEEN